MYNSWCDLPKLAFRLSRSTLWSERPLSSLGFFLIKLVARLLFVGGDVRLSLLSGNAASFGLLTFLCTDGDVK